MRTRLTALFLCFAILLGIAGTASGAINVNGQKTASGDFFEDPNIYTYKLGSLELEPCREDTIVGYDPATGVLFYVRQNPWSAFDPLGLKTKQDYRDQIAELKRKKDEWKKNRPKSNSPRLHEVTKWDVWIKETQAKIDKIDQTARALERYTKTKVDPEFLDDEGESYKEFNRTRLVSELTLNMDFAEHVDNGDYGEASVEFGKDVALTLLGQKVLGKVFGRGGNVGRGVANGPGCFVSGTLIATPNGTKRIDDIKVGDEVIAFDQNLNRAVTQDVLEVCRGATYNWVEIQVENEIIKATRMHPFWVNDRSEWVPAYQLKSGEKLTTLDGGLKAIRNIEVYSIPEIDFTYNIVVRDLHNYFVGSNQILVHNGHPTAHEKRLMKELRAGRDVNVRSVQEARRLLSHMNELKPAPGSGGPGTYAPRGTYRGDLVNTKPSEYAKPPKHGTRFKGPHYNINLDGKRFPAIRICP